MQASPNPRKKCTNICVGMHGETATTTLSVGAHQAHLAGGKVGVAVTCDQCHVVPTSTSHSNGTIDLAWGALAAQGGLKPAFDATAGTCAGTYCHGASLPGGTNKTPVWTKVDGTQDACGTCHANPPAAPHVQNTACGSCHAGYTQTSVNVATHIDGKVDVVALACNSCHGSAANNAPPLGTRGETVTTARAVGAHQAHLSGGSSKAVACGECHIVPGTNNHATGAVQVTFGVLAATGGAAPGWNGTTCASTYCHGSTLNAGGTLTTPSWTKVDGTQDACGTCHAIPPPAPHVQNTACGSCHAGYTASTVNAATHIDGNLDVSPMTCTSCHGTTGVNAAPPAGTRAETTTAARAVGAHQAHLAGAKVGKAVACSECHVVPTAMNHADASVQVVFGSLTKTGGAIPVWNGATCASTYCHGATLPGGANKVPAWTTVDGSQDACGTCHAIPPAAPHVTRTDCGSCHTGYSATTVNLATHIDGKVDVVALTCSSCHGTATRTAISGADANETAAPPADSLGNTAVTARGVGVHLAHVNQATWRAAPIACSECHSGAVPTSMTHSDGVVQFAFGALAKNATWGGVTPAPAWSGTTCASTYCWTPRCFFCH
jgi:predicted CxxxxCH...CXXCH cytochrome family protein